MFTALRHDNVVFEHETIYATGHGYFGCKFRFCTVVLLGATNAIFDNCSFDNCVWHVNLVLHDQDSCAGAATIIEIARRCVPAPPPSETPKLN